MTTRRNTRRTRGTSLIELMIGVALLGILAALGNSLSVQRRARVVESVQAERALQWLEYEADVRVSRAPADPGIVAALQDGLPGAALAVTANADKTTTLKVSWKGATGRPKSRELRLAGVSK